MIVDASAVYAYFVRNAGEHWGVSASIELAAETDELVISPFVVAEVYSMVGSRIDVASQEAMFEELVRGAWVITPTPLEHVRAMRAEIERGPALTLGMASSLVLAVERGELLLTVTPGAYPAANADGHPLPMARER